MNLKFMGWLLVAVTLGAAAVSAGGERRKIAVLDFAVAGGAQQEEGVDVADNIRLMFHSSSEYAVERYRRMKKAEAAALDAGLDLAALKDIVRLGKALGDDAVVTGKIAKEGDTYHISVAVNDVGAAAIFARADAEGVDLRMLTETLIQKLSGAEAFGVLFPDKVRDLSGEEEKETRRAISAIAAPEELALYDVLSIRGKSMFLDKFWLRRDPDPTTPENEYEDEFWRRVAYVQAHFSNPIHEGIRTDRGRVYLLYGPPDDIEDYSSGVASISGAEKSTWSTKPYYTWKYYGGNYTTGSRALFVFLDEEGDGEFEIFASTEPGYGKRVASFTEFDVNRLAVDAEDTAAAGETFWDPMRYGEGK